MSQTVFERHTTAPGVIQTALAGSINQPFWMDDVATRRVEYPPLREHTVADLAIVGGGFLGLWTAILAKERDPSRSVLLLEGRRVGWAASGRNGGFCEASITHGEDNGRSRWPEECERLDALGMQNLDEIAATIARYAIDCDFERSGVLTVAVEPYQVAQLHGDGCLSAAAIRAEVDSPTFLAGHWDRAGCAMLHPGKLALELARIAVGLGVRICEHSAVTALQPGADGVRLATAHGSVRAARVVLATNAFPSLLKRYRWHTIPVYDYVLMTEPLSAAQLASVGWRNRQGIADMGNQFHYYRITRDNRILFGGYDAVYNFGGKVRGEYDDRPASFARLAGHFFTTFPQLEGLRFSHRWGGAIDTSTRFCAFFGTAHGGRVAYAAGFTGLGVGATRFAGNVLLDRLEGLDTERTRLRMVRETPPPFPPEPLAWLAVQSTRWALNRADHNHGKRNLLLRTLDALGLGFDS
ncbi:NAD(P)/FAD-dependent oxidoreductase [Vogesella fluminis]|uniref:Oxidoreductase n=1 Tax=Vogesella fluminis TaxID=1069161 RepID=A0ABQ3H6Y5_9NEIS|nr:FAD-dependent oxidoreductase [Vogesella fluminis]GHD73772.1 oxidoreductase [Vogesella fluminis]